MAYLAASTVSTAPSVPVTFTRVPAGRSGPATRQTVSSSAILPVPPDMGSESSASRPI